MTTPEGRNPSNSNPFDKDNGSLNNSDAYQGGAHEAAPEGHLPTEGVQPTEPGFDSPRYEEPVYPQSEGPEYPSASSEIPGRPGEGGAPGSAAPYTGAAAGAPAADGAYPGGAYPGGAYPEDGYPEGGYPGAAPAGGGWGQPEEINKVAPWALGFAVVSVVAMFLLGPLVVPFAIVGVILGIIGVVKARKIEFGKRRMGMSVAAIIIGLITAILMAIGAAGLYYFFNDADLQECTKLEDKEAVQKCIEEKVQGTLEEKTGAN
ncbi:DUF4190 domain-containing protein [Corynebacterium spheniscorum]|uniref:DUF4190 domain-containing protein n=1 Tax=Corynebacterium spheniscorum TaxID=185761 RepID=A0A1I2U3B6_9CORY|nr:DUF4190 domain-containing protein [Corynebacterium spheniscorum]KAA8721777.1 DUF4190 domain-containing protein [Corynebacterium spheniscorum]SFG69346.1 hypothetical protein SAMN05660282_01655 [Corynebacterium spheniscorum]